jgi:uncharacterized protein YbjT (DUF2867 family)
VQIRPVVYGVLASPRKEQFMAKNTKKTILVSGATGHQGGAVLRQLRDKAFTVRALTRDPDSPAARKLVGHGTEVVRGDLNDVASLTRALDGCDGAFCVQPVGPDEVKQGKGLIDAIARSRVSHVVYSSVGAADRNTGIPHFETKHEIEEHLRGSGQRYTILRPVFFMENWLAMREQIESGVLPQPLKPDTRLQMVAVDDIGAVATMAFEKPKHWENRALELAGDELSMAELAQAFSRMSGREVRYEQIPWDQFEQQAGREMTIMYKWFEDVGYHVNLSEVRQFYSNPTSFDRWLNAKWSKYATA